MIQWIQFHGKIVQIQDIKLTGKNSGCDKILTVRNNRGEIVRFILDQESYVYRQELLVKGDDITVFYNGNAPAITIYPPEYHALILVKQQRGQSVYVGIFDHTLISLAGDLQLNLNKQTKVITPNGQSFKQNLFNRPLIVIYSSTTKSIPAQTTPSEIIVYCL